MLVKSWSFRATLCLALFFKIEAKPTVESNAFRNVAVSFSSKLSPEDGNHLVRSMQKILNEASTVLQTATGLRIGSVTFHLPRTWNSSEWPGVGSVSSYNSEVEPDIRVKSLTDSAFGKKPIALQYGGCGVPALDISIPHEFLMAEEEESYPKGKILAREWLKYRYGVFDENGFLDDPLYPTHYSIHGSDEIHITDCTSPKLDYSFRDSKNNSCVLTSETAANCSIRPNEEDLENVKSSLMFYHEELQQLDHVCGKDENIHNIGSPNKQNLLCSYKSIWDVLKSSDDFKSISSEAANVEIEYSFVQESELRLLVAWQDTLSLHEQGDAIKNFGRKLSYDIPDQSKFGLYNFKDDEWSPLIPFTDVTLTNRVTWQSFSNFGSSKEGKPLIAIGKAIDVLQQDNNEDNPGIIVILTDSNPDENSDLVEKLKKSKLCLTVIGFEGATKEAWSTFLDVSECSSYFPIAKSADLVVTYGNLYNAIKPILDSQMVDSEMHTVSTRKLSLNEYLEIPADPKANTFTVWVFGEAELECLENETAVNKIDGIPTPPLISFSFEAPNDLVKCNLKDMPPGSSFLVHAQVTTKEGEYLNNKVLLQDTTPPNSTEQMPYIIYATIFYGEYPVRDADVQAEVTTPSGEKVTLTLVDNGRGDPDVTQNDGIYSKYFTKLDSVGIYQVIVTVTDKGKANASRNGQDPCCGSVVVSDSFELSNINWRHEMSFETKLKKPENGYKPSRVTDLRVDSMKLPDSLTLKWTAPGGEMDEGKASDYEFIIFCQHQDCPANGILPNWISFSKKSKPKDFGKDEAVTVQFHENKPKNITVYLALKTINKNRLTSEISNRIYIKLIPSNPQETTTPGVIEDHTKPSNAPTAGSIVAYVIISISILMVICGVIYFLLDRTKRRRALEELNTPAALTSTDSGGEIFSFKFVAPPAENPIRRAESIPVVLYTHDQIKDYKDKTKQPPLYKSDVAPKPWASLNALIDGNGSSKSNSTVDVGDGKTRSTEIRPLDDVSLTTVPLHEKNARF